MSRSLQNHDLSRRDFLRLCGMSLAGAFLPALHPGGKEASSVLGRVTRGSESVYSEPDRRSPAVRQLSRDALLPLLGEITVPQALNSSPRWYEIDGGYLHGAYVQRIDNARRSPALETIPTGGILGEVTVPYTTTRYKRRDGRWMNLYRLYYGSVHWIMDLVELPDGELYYELVDEWLSVRYYALASDLRPVLPEETAPLAADVPPEEKWVEVSLAQQLLSAYEGRKKVLVAPVSTGRRWMETPVGEFQVNRKCPSKHMGDGGLTSNIHAYELLGVPWTSFFTTTGVALHGTFWHDNFGLPMSQGCVNLRSEDAKWLFRWFTPAYEAQDYETGRRVLGSGTRIVVR